MHLLVQVDPQLNVFSQVDYLLHRLDGLSQEEIDAFGA
jgi:hypothetical protein